MSSVDERIVRMQFDNSGFEAGATRAISILDKLGESLKFKNGTSGLDNVQKASNRFNMDGVGVSISVISQKFSAFQEFVTGVFRRLGERAVDFGTGLVKNVTLKPIMDGFSEYQTQMRSIQTIQANTGASVEDINSALDELNTYADKTIYNFTEMTNNIGRFTAAGVDLKTSTKAIQGISNLAAVSGSSAQQASTAMYQLSQALASGTVKLQDWNSVVNANMGGKVFQEALLRTARAHGIAVDSMIKKNGSFRESLHEGWLTSDILTETLGQLTISYKEVGDEAYNAAMQQLLNSNYSKEEAEDILALAKTAEEAATMVRTWSQLWDTVGEALGSGWATSFRIIVGDFNQATEFFTWASTKLSDIVNESSTARNAFLTEWAKEGGRDGVIGIIANSFEALTKAIKPVKEAFSDVFGFSGKDLADITKKFAKFTEGFVITKHRSKELKNSFKTLFSILKGGFSVVGRVVSYFGKLASSISQALTISNAFRRIVNVLKRVSTSFYKVLNAIGTAFSDAFTISDSTTFTIQSFVTKVIGYFEKLASKLEISDDKVESIRTSFKKLFDAIKTGANPLKTFGDFLSGVVGDIFEKVSNIDLSSIFSSIGDSLGSFDLSKGLALGGSIFGILTAKDVVDSISKFVDGLNSSTDKLNPFKPFKDALDTISTAINDFQERTKFDKLKEMAKALGFLAGAMLVLSFIPSDKIATSLITLAGGIGELFIAVSLFSTFGKTKKIAVADVLVSLSISLMTLSVAMLILSKLSWDDVGKGLFTITTLIIDLSFALSHMPESGKIKESAKSIKKIATAILILSISIAVLSFISWDGIGKGLFTIITLLISLTFVINNMPDSGRLLSSAVAITAIATGILVLSAAIVLLSTISWDGIGKGLFAIITLLISLTFTLNNMPDSGRLLSSSIAIIAIATGILVLSAAIVLLSTISWDGIGKGLFAIITLLISLTFTLNNMPDSGRLLSSSIAIIAISVGLLMLSGVITSLSSISWDGIGKGLFAIITLLISLTFALNMMPDSGRLLSSAVAIVAISAGLLIMSNAMTAFAALDWEGIAKGLVTVAVLLVELGVAAMLIQSNLLGAVSILIMAEALNILAGALNTIGNMSPMQIVTGILGMAAALGAICAVAYLAKPAIPYLVAIAASLLVIGIAAGTLISAVTEAANALSNLAQPAIEAGANMLQGFINGVLQYGSGLIDTAMQIGKSFLDSIRGFFGIASPSTVMQGIGENVVQGLINGIGNLIGNLGSKALEIGSAVLNGVGDIAGGLKDKAVNGMTAFTNGVGSFVGSATSKGSEIVGGVINGAKDLVGKMKTKATDGMNSFVTGMSSKISTVKSTATKIANSVVDGFKNLASRLKSTVSSAMDGVSSAISGAAGKISGAVSNIKNRIIDGFSGLYGTFRSIGENIGSGLKVGMDGITAAVTEKARDMGRAAANAAKQGAQVASPSKLTIKTGQFIGEGLIVGMSNRMSKVIETGEKLGKNAIEGCNEAVSGMALSIQDVMDTEYEPVITPVINPAQFNSDLSSLNRAMNMNMNRIVLDGMNYNAELNAKMVDYADSNNRALQAIADGVIDYNLLGTAVATALINSGIHVEMDGGQLMGYLAGEIRDVRRMYG